MTYTADPRAEELQLLRQLERSPILATHKATLMIAVRLERRGEIEGGFVQSNGDVRLYITDAGRDALKGEKG